MPILKNKTQGKYVNVYKGIAMDRSLSLRDRGMMLTLLSLPDNWEFTIAGLGKILPDGKAAIHASLKNLQNVGYLSKNQSRNDKGVFGENVIEVYETPNTPFPDFRQTENPVTDNPATEKPVPDFQPQLNNNKVINQETNINVLTNQSIYQDLEMDVMDSMETYMDIVKRNIEYECLLENNPYKKDVIEEILNLIVETLSVKRKTLRIAGAEYPYELVRDKFLRLEMGHIQYVLDCMNKNATKIRNIKNYVLTALYNALNTIGNYYQSEVKHDMHGGEM